jgi:hypothetical protein
MAYTKPIKDEDEEEQQLPIGEPTTKTEGGALVGTEQASGVPPTTLSPQKSGLSGFTDIQAYLQANKPQTESVATRLAGRLGEEATATREKIKQAESLIGEQVGAGKTSKDEALLARAIETPTEVVKSPEELAKITAMRTAAYKGPATVEELTPYEEARQAVGESERRAGLTETKEGRKELLYGLAKSPTRGQMTLDELLLSQDPKAREILSGGSAQFGDLKGYLESVRTAGAGSISGAQAETEKTRQDVSTSLQDAITKAKANLEERVGTARGTAGARSTAALNSLTTGDFSPEVMADLGITPEQAEKLKLAITEAQQYKAPLDLAKYSSQLSPETEITAGKTATAEDYARSAALAQLSGLDRGYLTPGEEGMAGTAGMDMTNFDVQRALDEGTSLISAQDKNLIDLFAQRGGDRSKMTADELAQLDEAMAREAKYVFFKGLTQTGEKIAGTLTNIGTGAMGAAKELGKETIKNFPKMAGEALGNIPKDIGQGLEHLGGQIYEHGVKPVLNAPKEAVQTVKDIISKPAKIVTTPINQAKKALKKIFCFDGRTLVMMADGTEKEISQIDLGDRVFKGGEVDSIRKSAINAQYKFNYHNIIVTGWHAVRDNGIWRRIKDCSDAVPYYLEGDVYSICTTNHRMFVKGIEFADEHETDNYENLTIDESLDQLNRTGMTIEYSEVK